MTELWKEVTSDAEDGTGDAARCEEGAVDGTDSMVEYFGRLRGLGLGSESSSAFRFVGVDELSAIEDRRCDFGLTGDACLRRDALPPSL